MDYSVYILITALHVFEQISRGARGDETSGDPAPVHGLVKKSIQLRCTLPVSADSPRVQWFDFVYNSNKDPSRIFDSENNSDLHIMTSHHNKASYEVDSNFTLVINDLKIDNDPGEYFCRSWTNETHYEEKSYYLTVGELPTCTATATQLRIGDKTVLTCESKYSGNDQPELRWFRDEQLIDSEDQFEIRTAKRSVTLTATHSDDKLKFVCVMEFGEVGDECHIKLDIVYAVRDLEFLPVNKTTLYVGDQLTCRARGNPTPKISVETPQPVDRKVSLGSRLIDINKEWRERNITVRCHATNIVDGQTFKVNNSLNISVLDRPSSTLPPAKPTALAKSKIDSNPGIVVGAIIIVALSLLAVIGAVVLVRKHRDQQRRKAEAAKAEANKKQQDNQKKP